MDTELEEQTWRCNRADGKDSENWLNYCHKHLRTFELEQVWNKFEKHTADGLDDDMFERTLAATRDDAYRSLMGTVRELTKQCHRECNMALALQRLRKDVSAIMDAANLPRSDERDPMREIDAIADSLRDCNRKGALDQALSQYRFNTRALMLLSWINYEGVHSTHSSTENLSSGLQRMDVNEQSESDGRMDEDSEVDMDQDSAGVNGY